LYDEIKSLKSKIETVNFMVQKEQEKLTCILFKLKRLMIQNLKQNFINQKNAEKIASLSKEATVILYSADNAVLDGILKAKKIIELMNFYGEEVSRPLSLIEQSYYQAEEVYRKVENILSNNNLDPERLNALLERAELIKKLKKKIRQYNRKNYQI
jgi:DNA repair protein RecN (Recombination protein N)